MLPVAELLSQEILYRQQAGITDMEDKEVIKRRLRKKWLAAALALSLAAAGLPLLGGSAREVLAETTVSGDFTIDENGVLTKYNGTGGSVVIPEGVTSIGGEAFEGCVGLTEITIPSSVTLIGSYAFSGCVGLTEITIPSSVTLIGSQAFLGCSGLTKVTIPSSVTCISYTVFGGCVGLKEVTIPSSVTRIESDAFNGCSGLTAITVDKDNKVYDSRDNSNAIIYTETNTLIAGCQNTVIPNSVTSIEEGAFSGRSGLTEVMIPSNVTSIGEGAFSGCSGLTAITVDKDNKVYDSRNNSNAIIETETNELIAGCQNTVIPNNVTSIGSQAFYGCSGLTEVMIPSSVTSIGDNAFYECSGLKGVTISSSVVSIGNNAFLGCSGLTAITVDKDNKVYDSRDNSNAIIETETNTLILGCQNTVIPNNVTSIGSNAFSGCSGLTKVTIPSSVTRIGQFAFNGCSGLKAITVDKDNKVYDSRDNSNAIIKTETNTLILGCQNTVIPNSVTSIGGGAFYGCSGLTKITIPSSVTEIWWQAFSGCSGLTEITIPSSVTEIETWVFYECSEELIIRGQTGSYVQEYAKENNMKFIPLDAIKGDMDGDGELTLSDVQLALKAALKIITLDGRAAWAADVDGEPGISLNDAFLILEKALDVRKTF